MQSPDYQNAGIFVSLSIPIITVLRAEKLAKGMTCVTNETPCNICANFTEEQHIKIKHRRRYVRKQKVSDPCNTSKDDLDLLGFDVEAFSGSRADLEGAADNLFSSPPCPQLLRFNSLSSRTPQTVPPIPGTALQNKIESRLENLWVISLTSNSNNKWGSFKCPCSRL